MFSNNQWMRLSVVLLIALLARMALGADANTAAIQSTAPIAVAKPVIRESIEPASLQVTVMPGLALVGNSASFNGWTAFSTAVNLLAQLPDSPLLVGLELGADLGETNLSADLTALRALATVILKGTVAGSPALHPYAGVAVGPQYVLTTQRAGGVTTDSKRVYLQALLRVGMSWDLSQSVSIGLEPRAGLTGESLTFNPLAFANISL